MTILEELKVKESKYLKKLEEKRLLLGESDGPTQSRFPTGRFELEQEIEVYEKALIDLRHKINSIISP